MARRALGRFSKGTVESLKRAEAMQAEAVLFIKEEFSTEDDPKLELEGLSWDRFIRDLESAEKNDTKEEFDRVVADMLRQAIPLVFQPEQQ